MDHRETNATSWSILVLLLGAGTIQCAMGHFGEKGGGSVTNPAIPDGDRCLQLREELVPCSASLYGILPPAPSAECCSALWSLTTEAVCSCAVGPVGWKEIFLRVMGDGGLINIPAALRIPFQCKVARSRPGFLCSPPL